MKRAVSRRFQAGLETDHDEFYFYLSANTFAIQRDRSSLFRWKDLAKEYSALAEMTADVLAIPIAGVGIERAFSLARQVVDVNRARLFSETIKQIMMLKCSSSIVSFEEEEFTFEFKWCSSKERELAAQIKIDEQDKIMGITLSMFTVKDVKDGENMDGIIENDFNWDCWRFLKKC